MKISKVSKNKLNILKGIDNLQDQLKTVDLKLGSGR